jgi:hypothetical protein
VIIQFLDFAMAVRLILAIFYFFKFVLVTNISYTFHFDLFWPCGENIISYTYHTSTIIIVTVTQVYRFTSRALFQKNPDSGIRG